MARLPGLVSALAQHDRRGKPTIAHIARQIRDGDLIASKVRGVGASVMTMKDAATLLMAVIGDSSPQGAVAAVHNLRALQPLPWDKIDRMKRADLPAQLKFLKPKMGFADTVEQMIAHAPTLAEWSHHYMGPQEGADPTGGSAAEASMLRAVKKFRSVNIPAMPSYARPIRIVCYVPGVAAEVHLGMPWDQVEEDDAFHEYYGHPALGKGPAGDGAGLVLSDCLSTMEIGLPTLLALHQAVRGSV